MCGIIAGSTPGKEILPVLMDGLKELEPRGYDSFGVATFGNYGDGKDFRLYQAVGQVHPLPPEYQSPANSGLFGHVGMGHTRWATHGEINKRNAHPIVEYGEHRTSSGMLTQRMGVVVHNGIVDNADAHRRQFQVPPLSDTDTAIIAKLFALFSAQAPELPADRICERVVSRLNGDFAFVAWCSGRLVAFRRKMSLFISLDRQLVASEVGAFPPGTHARPLDDGEIVLLADTRHDPSQTTTEAPKKVVITPPRTPRKEGEHSMLREIREQPDTILKCELVPDLTLDCTCTFIGCGSSYYAALLGSWPMIETGPDHDCQHASEFRRPYWHSATNRKIVALTQSGETKDVLDVLRTVPIPICNRFSITNSAESSVTHFSVPSYLYAGKEDGVAATKTFTGQVVSLWKTAASLHGGVLWKVIESLPECIRGVLDHHKSGNFDFIHKLTKYRNALVLGRGVNHPVALEGALKLKEVAYVHAEALPAAEIKHGPIALIDDSVLTIALMDYRLNGFSRALSNLHEIKSRGGKILAIYPNHTASFLENVADFQLELPATSAYSASISMVVALQLLSYEWAVAKGLNPDRPRSLAKSVTV